jgi:hypothetical protein
MKPAFYRTACTVCRLAEAEKHNQTKALKSATNSRRVIIRKRQEPQRATDCGKSCPTLRRYDEISIYKTFSQKIFKKNETFF